MKLKEKKLNLKWQLIWLRRSVKWLKDKNNNFNQRLLNKRKYEIYNYIIKYNVNLAG